jgi:hypothetical protein
MDIDGTDRLKYVLFDLPDLIGLESGGCGSGGGIINIIAGMLRHVAEFCSFSTGRNHWQIKHGENNMCGLKWILLGIFLILFGSEPAWASSAAAHGLIAGICAIIAGILF